MLSDQGDLSGALEHYRQSLSITRAALGDDHTSVAGTLNNIGNVSCVCVVMCLVVDVYMMSRCSV